MPRRALIPSGSRGRCGARLPCAALTVARGAARVSHTRVAVMSAVLGAQHAPRPARAGPAPYSRNSSNTLRHPAHHAAGHCRPGPAAACGRRCTWPSRRTSIMRLLLLGLLGVLTVAGPPVPGAHAALPDPSTRQHATGRSVHDPPYTPADPEDPCKARKLLAREVRPSPRPPSPPPSPCSSRWLLLHVLFTSTASPDHGPGDLPAQGRTAPGRVVPRPRADRSHGVRVAQNPDVGRRLGAPALHAPGRPR